MVVPAPEPELGQQLSDAMWVKVFTTTVENPDPVELNDLVLGNAAVPPETEIEIEWVLLQTDPNNPDRGEQLDENDVAGANESVTRRYEFYKYTGAYDVENHEALNESYDPAYVGDYLGNQNVAANLAPIPEPSTYALALSCLASLGLLALRKKSRRA